MNLVNQQPIAFLFDLNGTMIDDMEYHIRAWHDIFNALGANLTMEGMKAQCYGRNDELIERILPGRFSKDEIRTLSLAKEAAYQEAYRPKLTLIDGLAEFLETSYVQRIPMAIGSAAIMSNIDFVLDGLGIRHYFASLVSADDVLNSKPDPETYIKCAAALDIEPSNCIVFEDSPKGVESASRAGMRSVVIRGVHTEDEFEGSSGIIRMVNDFRELHKGFGSGLWE